MTLHQLRTRAGLTQQRLAERIGVSALTIRNWERRRHVAQARYWSRLRAALRCKPQELTAALFPAQGRAQPKEKRSA